MSKDTFVWTDALIEEYIRHRINMARYGHHPHHMSIEQFKQSKMPKKDKDYEVIEIENKVGGRIRKTRDDKSWYEVFSLKNFDGFKINAVKRLSDGEVFSMGEEVQMFGTQPIESFSIMEDGGAMIAYFKSAWANINQLKKLPPQSKPEQPKKERIEVKHFKMYEYSEGHVNQVFWYSFCVYKNIPNDKMNSVKAAIERVLNDEEDNVRMQEWNMYQSQLREAEEKAFNRAREETTPYIGSPRYFFPDFESYHKSKQ